MPSSLLSRSLEYALTGQGEKTPQYLETRAFPREIIDKFAVWDSPPMSGILSP